MNTQESLPSMDRKDFFRLVGVSVGAIILQQCLSGCSTGTKDPEPDPTPISDFSFNINSSNAAPLKNLGGYIYINGIIVARALDGSYLAVAQACTHEGTRLNYESSTNTFVCPNHGSVFSNRGVVQKGPATKDLVVYRTEFNASTGDFRVLV
ncbi:Rieske (2Fe-2S) protein [Runella sp. MFBS21]|uniref:ubiquinol-cytochrome c reductase iron-sulfur subunit n=1 Tax=Runella sp. MFBS21 TaxID=3034018 RepID=UPI0023F802D0|nr:Rieske (2Fe-2S) protein [Runella sp. MFBS21]MDF7820612.1 Rieske (2Fe-2S) protein [Runella sp. MFBS21]